MSLRNNTGAKAASFTGQQLPVHTQPFAFRAHEEDDESVKMSNTTSRRTSALSPALPSGRPCASDYATSIVILPALSDFCEGSSAPLLHAGRRITPSFSVRSAFRCVLCGKTFAFLRSLCPPKRQFLFDTNKPFTFTTNFSARTKQSAYFSLFDTNERLRITDHRSLISNTVAPTGKFACTAKG
jgi:hypothetical protein